NHFNIMLTNQTLIDHARDLIKNRTTDNPHVMGIVVPKRALYNPFWSYHLDSKSIVFFDFAIEVCDAAISYVQEHLSEVGGAFLPGNIWCPWSSQVVNELSI
ncbi:hypothetical protein SAMD00019534_030100, partial [Acytostelium subglobosum LB1]|uniref:hypothetical protein n=1 Tax=Acytostelium subglobosum LB1 TaxID=1410327 RepID=UPI00064504BF